MTPYYKDPYVTIYHSAAQDILPSLKADTIITDPPYGVGLDYGDQTNDTPENWRALMSFLIPQGKVCAPFMILPCCRILELPWIYAQFPPDWLLCWYKGSPGSRSPVGFNDWEPHLVYGKPHAQMHDFFQSTPEPFDNGHPCPKPMSWANWLVSRAVPPQGSVIDPFCGSGTVLSAAKNLHRQAIGIDIEERFCEISARRCSQEVLL